MVNLFVESILTCVPIHLFSRGSQLKLHRLFFRLLQRGSSHDSVVRCHLLRKCSVCVINDPPQASLLRLISVTSCPLPRLNWSSPHPISNSQLHVLPHFHLCPIYLVVFKGVYFTKNGISHLEGGFTLRCLQRLSLPDLATRPWLWQANRSTSGPSIPVLSY